MPLGLHNRLVFFGGAQETIAFPQLVRIVLAIVGASAPFAQLVFTRIIKAFLSLSHAVIIKISVIQFIFVDVFIFHPAFFRKADIVPGPIFVETLLVLQLVVAHISR